MLTNVYEFLQKIQIGITHKSKVTVKIEKKKRKRPSNNRHDSPKPNKGVVVLGASFYA